ncbi:MAG: type II toxin-antitoxin system prevent-host-death family antitoxin [Rhodocyclaceae bacterium]|nr:type II toxin-antitoxin system prevent-host-death family antitoxin [Rhodocyclaceae bacterium]MDZ4215118.1 type II toxin-antitoxin system prevent-host-death family antitoxin [Rhodocyclaceae bacterium]
MITITSVEAQSRFGELIDRAQREPIAVTRRGRTVAYVVSEHEMRELADLKRREGTDKSATLAKTLAAWNDFNAKHGAFADEHSTL